MASSGIDIESLVALLLWSDRMALRLLTAALAALLPITVHADCGRAILDQPACRIDSVVFVCDSKERYEALEGFILADEHDLYQREVMASVMAGRCDLYVPGNEVWRVGNSGWDGFVEVRRRGQSKAFWIRSDALRVSSVPASEAADDGLPPAYSP